MSHAAVHWPGSFTADATIAAASLASGAGLAGDVVAMTGVFACLVTVAVTAPAGTRLDSVYYAPLGAADSSGFMVGPTRIIIDPEDPAAFRPAGKPGQLSDGSTFYGRFTVYGEDFPAFKHWVFNATPSGISVTVNYQLTTAV